MSDSVATTVADKGLLSRAIGVIVSPAPTFAVVAQHPRPAGILLVVCLVLGLATGLPQLTERGRQNALDLQVQQIERSGRAVTPEMHAQLAQFGQYSGYITIASMFVVLPVFSMLFGALYWAVFNAILGGTAAFKQVLGIVTHAQVISALGGLVSAPFLLMGGQQSVAGPFNLGALAPMLEPGTAITNFLSGISVFTLWQVVATAIGLAALYRRRATGIIIGLVAVYLLLTAAFTTAFSSFTGR